MPNTVIPVLDTIPKNINKKQAKSSNSMGWLNELGITILYPVIEGIFHILEILIIVASIIIGVLIVIFVILGILGEIRRRAIVILISFPIIGIGYGFITERTWPAVLAGGLIGLIVGIILVWVAWYVNKKISTNN